jgi:HSP20 family protein
MSTNSCTNQKEGAQQTAPKSVSEAVTFTPRVDIVENEKELFLYADLPGVGSEDVELCFENGQLTLSGHVKPRLGDKQFVLREYGEGDFYRAFGINETIDATKIEASCKQGVLTVRLPKVEAAKPRQIAVTAQ